MTRILILIFLICEAATSVFSQAVRSGNFEAGAGTGFGIFQVSNNDTEDNSSIGVSGILQGHFEYAPIDDLNLGLIFQRNGFLTEKDSGDNVQAYLAGLGIKYRVVNGENTVAYLGLDGGPSWMHYYDNQSSNYVNGSGYWFDLTAGMRYYITNKAGIFVELSYLQKHFTHFKDKDNNLLMIGPYTNRSELELDLSGMNLRIGLNFKFGKNNGKS